MPTYAYACTECSHHFEIVQSFTDDSLTECPRCQGRLRKLFNAVGVVFKGSGFYRTDSRSGDGSGGRSSTVPATAGSGGGSNGAAAGDKGNSGGSGGSNGSSGTTSTTGGPDGPSSSSGSTPTGTKGSTSTVPASSRSSMAARPAS